MWRENVFLLNIDSIITDNETKEGCVIKTADEHRIVLKGISYEKIKALLEIVKF